MTRIIAILMLMATTALAQSDMLLWSILGPRKSSANSFTNTWSASAWFCERDIPAAGVATQWVNRISGGPLAQQSDPAYRMIAETVNGESVWHNYGTNFLSISPAISCVDTMAVLSVYTRPSTNSPEVAFGTQDGTAYSAHWLSAYTNRIYIRTDGTARYISSTTNTVSGDMMVFWYRTRTNTTVWVNGSKFGSFTQQVASGSFNALMRQASTWSIGYHRAHIIWTNRPFSDAEIYSVCYEYNTSMTNKVCP